MEGNDVDHPTPDEESKPADAFALVGHDIRVGIIRVLGEDPGEDTLSFGELRSRIESDVEPSQLHYHLQQLVGPFVKQTDDGYQLRAVGERLCRTLRAGIFNRRQKHMTVGADFECHYCQTPVEAAFDDGDAKIMCSSCGCVYVNDYLDIPLETFEDEVAAFLYYSKYMILKTLFPIHGVCYYCANPLQPEFQSVDETTRPRKVLIDQSCDLCGTRWTLTVGMALLADHEFIAFCHDHGVDVLSTPFWELEFAATDKHVTVRSTDPWEVALAVTFDCDTLEIVVDGDLNVIERNHLSRDDDRASGDDVDLLENAAYLEALRDHRWPDGVTCPHCNSGDTTKKGMTGKNTQRYRCHDCDSIFNDLTGTIFAERRLSLPEMVHIIREMDETKTVDIARHLDRHYTSVLDFVQEPQNTRDEDIDFDLTSLSEGDDLL